MRPALTIAATAAAMILTLGACGSKSSADQAAGGSGGGSGNAAVTVLDKLTAGTKAEPAGKAPPPATREQLLAAAEQFEALTIAALKLPPGDLTTLRMAARGSAEAVRTSLAPDLAAQLSAALAKIDLAAQQGKPEEIALGATESWRMTLLGAAGDPAMPLPLDLLTNAAWRYTADTHTLPPDWHDASETLAFAYKQWNTARQRFRSDTGIKAFDDTLVAMQEAIAHQDVAAGRAAAGRLLAQIDPLIANYRLPAGAKLPAAAPGQ